jgi:hypothetical protein
MKILYVVSTLIACFRLVCPASTFLLIPHWQYHSPLFQTTRSYPFFFIYWVEPWKMSAPITFSHFTVHVFINHEPSFTSIYLPDLFSEFPDLAWQLPQEYATPRRPEVPDIEVPGETPGHVPRNILDQLLLTDQREGLGRHIFHQPLLTSTTLRELLEGLESEFNLNRKFIAAFTIPPQWHLEDSTYPEWHNKPLPWNTTLAEVAMLDHDAVIAGQYAWVAD